jgi:hypothetical protein
MGNEMYFNEKGVKIWTTLIWLRIEPIGGLL